MEDFVGEVREPIAGGQGRRLYAIVNSTFGLVVVGHNRKWEDGEANHSMSHRQKKHGKEKHDA